MVKTPTVEIRRNRVQLNKLPSEDASKSKSSESSKYPVPKLVSKPREQSSAGSLLAARYINKICILLRTFFFIKLVIGSSPDLSLYIITQHKKLSVLERILHIIYTGTVPRFCWATLGAWRNNANVSYKH